jgi:hypothetical protein
MLMFFPRSINGLKHLAHVSSIPRCMAVVPCMQSLTVVVSFINETSEMMAEYGRPQTQTESTNGNNAPSALPERTPSPVPTPAQDILHFPQSSNASQDLQDLPNGSANVRLSLTPPQSSHSGSSYQPFVTSPISTSNPNPQTVPIHIRDLLQADDESNDALILFSTMRRLNCMGRGWSCPSKLPTKRSFSNTTWNI